MRRIYREIILKLRAAKRVGAFGRGRKLGMSIEQARAYSNQLYPPTAEDLAYEAKLRHADVGVLAFPWASTLSLLYPVSATIYIATRTPASSSMVAGYGLANLGYLLFGAGILSGKFGIFGLTKRWQVLALALVFFVLGTFLSNV